MCRDADALTGPHVARPQQRGQWSRSNSGHKRIGAGYYLQPQGTVAAKPYLVLRHALERASRVAVARFAWHGRERLGLLRVRGDAIALHGLL
ncbi:Ku protein [Streptomyces sp. 3214.6]|uniref:Ku protein n=1 Tax=Streptomyces sp. 3214.6 TaxID=1882757 RepID=UPI002F918D94